MKKTRTGMRLLLLATAAALIPACDDDEFQIVPSLPVGLLNGFLTEDQVVPPTGSAQTGGISIAFDGASIVFTLTLSPALAANVTDASIHVSPLGVNGALLFPLLGIPAAAYPANGILSGTLTSADLNAASLLTFDQAAAALLAGDTYGSILTVANPGGEIRGQIGHPAMRAALDNAQGVGPPTPATGATATFTLTINRDQTEIRYLLSITGILDANVLNVHVHQEQPGVNGIILFPLHLVPTAYANPLTGTLTAANLDGAAGVTFAQALTAIRNGAAYVNVQSVAFPAGEIRGQVLQP